MRLIDHTHASLLDYTCAQLGAFFPSGDAAALRRRLDRALPRALERLAHCIGHVRMWPHGEFNYLNSSQYCIYLYYLGNTVWREHQDADAATRLFLLNKALNGIDLFYEIPQSVAKGGHAVGFFTRAELQQMCDEAGLRNLRELDLEQPLYAAFVAEK